MDSHRHGPSGVTVELGQDYPELREAVRRLCQSYPGEYWRRLDAQSGYPTAFVTELTEAGFLGALIPEEYGGTGLPLRAAAVILETINASGCTASPAHAQMYIMGTLLRHGARNRSGATCPTSPPARCGCRRSASPSPPPARTPRSSRPVPSAAATPTSSPGRRSGPRARCTRT